MWVFFCVYILGMFRSSKQFKARKSLNWKYEGNKQKKQKKESYEIGRQSWVFVFSTICSFKFCYHIASPWNHFQRNNVNLNRNKNTFEWKEHLNQILQKYKLISNLHLRKYSVNSLYRKVDEFFQSFQCWVFDSYSENSRFSITFQCGPTTQSIRRFSYCRKYSILVKGFIQIQWIWLLSYLCTQKERNIKSQRCNLKYGNEIWSYAVWYV